MMRTALPLTLLLAACAADDQAYPRLLPTDEILAEPVLPDHAAGASSAPEPVEDDLERRGSGLRDRANALRRPVIEPEFRDQIDTADNS
ncbi:hypothetical protein MLD63_05730 [Paracoccus sp. TK19116]|uniref:DUF3035 domain-containing protein n=1 Tax=Paracoccus albicereus TaxID=2922394 RepID=A0ABT1MP88_9RHOB|nr:hypothetical protein [Paracoccus albicereus]MCQ0969924.1 hypothetical protein [Paracoccus albicereus]